MVELSRITLHKVCNKQYSVQFFPFLFSSIQFNLLCETKPTTRLIVCMKGTYGDIHDLGLINKEPGYCLMKQLRCQIIYFIPKALSCFFQTGLNLIAEKNQSNNAILNKDNILHIFLDSRSTGAHYVEWGELPMLYCTITYREPYAMAKRQMEL